MLLAVLALAWSGPGASHFGAPSPDGRFLSGVHPDSGELLLRDLETGIRRRLGRKTANHEHASYSVFSHDSKWIAYTWLNAERHYELRIAAVETLAERTVFTNDGDGIVQVCAVSPDASQLLALRIRGPGSEIVLVAVETGAVKVVKRLAGPPPHRIDLSPDGRSIAYRNSLIDADGSFERKLVEGLDGDLSPLFSRDGRSVFLIARDAGLWRAGLESRKPVLVREGIGPAYLQGVTNEGRLFFGRLVGTGNVYRAKFDPKDGKLASDPEPIGDAEPQTALPAVLGSYHARDRELWRTGGEAPVATFPRAITALAATRDGEAVAIAQSTTLTVLSPKGRAESRAASETISGLAWTADAQHLVTIQNDSLWWWSASLENFRRIVKLPQGTIGSVSLEAGDTAILFTAGRPRSEVWSLAVDAR